LAIFDLIYFLKKLIKYMTEIPRDKDNSVYSYMDWKTITNKNSAQYKLRIKYNTYDSNGLADIEGRKVVACTSTFGSIGDEIEVTFKKGVNYFNKQSKTLFQLLVILKIKMILIVINMVISMETHKEVL
jgi:hypothetical protein